MPERRNSRNAPLRPLPGPLTESPHRVPLPSPLTGPSRSATFSDRRHNAALAVRASTHPRLGQPPPYPGRRAPPRHPYGFGHRQLPGRRPGPRYGRSRASFRSGGRDPPMGRIRLCAGPGHLADVRYLAEHRPGYGRWARRRHRGVPYATAPVRAHVRPAGIRPLRRMPTRAAPWPAQPYRHGPAPGWTAPRSSWAAVAARLRTGARQFTGAHAAGVSESHIRSPLFSANLVAGHGSW